MTKIREIDRQMIDDHSVDLISLVSLVRRGPHGICLSVEIDARDAISKYNQP